MSTDTKNQTIALYVKSDDRYNITDSTTNFTLKLRKSLRNISSIDVVDVSIPRTNRQIDSRNNTIIGNFISNGLSEEFNLTIPSGNYTETELVAELQKQFSTVLTAYDLTWSIVYNTTTMRIDISVNYSQGSVVDWGIEFLYMNLVDIIGIGDVGTTTRVFNASKTDTLIISTGRSPSIIRNLKYNITSKTLTNSINTSYFYNLSKRFNIDDSNNNIDFAIQKDYKEEKFILDYPDDTIPNFSVGKKLSMSSDGNIIVAGSDRGVYTWIRILVNGFWEQRVNTPLSDVNVLGLSLSGDGKTLAVGHAGGTTIYERNGYNWLNKDTIALPSFSVDLSSDGLTIAIGDPDVNTDGTVWIYKYNGSKWIEDIKIDRSTIENLAVGGKLQFGYTVAISPNGEVLAISALLDDNKGAVYVFEYGNTWVYKEKIVPPTSYSNVRSMGKSIDLNNNTLVISSPQDNNGSGTVFVYTGDSWDIVKELILPTPSIISSVSISNDGNTIAIGTPLLDSYNGYVYISKKTDNGWSQLDNSQRLQGTDGQNAQQGISTTLSYDGNVLAFSGAQYTIRRGAIWVWENSPFIERQKLLPVGGIGETMFGNSIAQDINGTTMLVGAPRDGGLIGACFVYVRKPNSTMWVQQAKLSFGDAQAGWVCDISDDGNIAVIGTYTPANQIEPQSRIAIYKRSGESWSLMQEFSKPLHNYGSAVAISGDGTRIVVGGWTTKIFIYDFTTVWEESKILEMPGSMRLGYSLGIGNNIIVAIGRSSVGKLYIWEDIDAAPITVTINEILNDVNISRSGNVIVVSGEDNTYLYDSKGIRLNALGKPSLSNSISDDGRTIAITTFTEAYIYKFINAFIVYVSVLTKTIDFGGSGPRRISMGSDGVNFITSSPEHNRNLGRVTWYATGTFIDHYKITIPEKVYTIFDLTKTLNNLFAENKIVLVFDNNELVVMQCPPDVLINIINTTTQDVCIFNEGFKNTHISEPINMTVNNNVMKTIMTSSSKINDVIIDTTPSKIYRKYRAGFTIEDTEFIDIQLRDRFDGIIDLNGSNWCMTLLCSIHH
jgi:hypothetical protein